MRNRLLTGCLFNLIVVAGYGQTYKGQIDFAKVPPPAQHYQEEYTFDTTLNLAAWTTQQKGLHVSFASTDELYFRTEVPELVADSFGERGTVSFEETCWKGQRLNAMVLVWSPDTLQQVRILLNDLKNLIWKRVTICNPLLIIRKHFYLFSYFVF